MWRQVTGCQQYDLKTKKSLHCVKTKITRPVLDSNPKSTKFPQKPPPPKNNFFNNYFSFVSFFQQLFFHFSFKVNYFFNNLVLHKNADKYQKNSTFLEIPIFTPMGQKF